MQDTKVIRQYGRLNPEVSEEMTFARVRHVETGGHSLGKDAAESFSNDRLDFESSREEDIQTKEDHASSPNSSLNTSSPLLNLSYELIDLIFAFLSPRDLDKVACTCRLLHQLSDRDRTWQKHVQDNVPGCELESPAPFSTWRELFRAHDPHWFLSKYKIWFGDYFLTGKLILVRYNPKTASMEGYRLVAQRKVPEFEHWEFDNEVIIHSFTPHVKLHLNLPVLELCPNHVSFSTNPSPSDPEATSGEQHKERSVAISSVLALHVPPSGRRHHLTFELCRIIPTDLYMSLWPPHTIPAPHRVRNSSQQAFHGTGHRPSRLSEISEIAFRIRSWVNPIGSGLPRYGLYSAIPQFGNNPAAITGLRMSQEVETFATLDPKLYTPTPSKPYRGLWVGDYSGHGCEFLLMHQPDDKELFESITVVQREDETPAEFIVRKEEERIYRGSIEAIKLTGDPNVARGEYTFIADDIGADGFVRYADEKRFEGARIVKSRGHVAEAGGGNDKYIESQLIMISPDKLAQYWVGFGHISFYERIHIDQFLNPSNDPEPEISPRTV